MAVPTGFLSTNLLRIATINLSFKVAAVKNSDTLDMLFNLGLDALEQYPDSDKLNARIFVNYYKNGDIHNALVTLKKLEGRKLSSDVFNELNPIVQAIKSMLQKENSR